MKSVLITMLSLLLVLAAVAPAQAEVPDSMQFQGYLSDAQGAPLEGELSLTFTLYDAASGGNPLWTQTLATTPVNGMVSVALGGSGNPLDASVFSGSDLYLGVTVGDNAEMSPRQPVRSVPYAVRASVADRVDEVSWSDVADKPAGFADGTDDVRSDAEILELVEAQGYLVAADLAELATEAWVADTFYTRGDVDNLLAAYYTAAEIDTLFSAYYNASQVDDLLLGFSATDHDHDGVYALTSHAHDAYALTSHSHDLAYAPLGHDHDADYAAIAHNHDTTYSALTHNHDSAYSALEHGHGAADITSGLLDLERFSAMDNLDYYNNIGAGSDQLARGDHGHAQYVAPVNVIYVAHTGDATTSGTVLRSVLSGISTASESNPVLVQLEAGVYDVGTSPAILPDYVSIAGVGRDVTILRSTVYVGSLDSGTIITGLGSMVRDMTVEDNTTGYGVAIYASKSGLRLERAILRVDRGLGMQYGIYLRDSADSVLEDVQIDLSIPSGTPSTSGVRAYNSVFTAKRLAITILNAYQPMCISAATNSGMTLEDFSCTIPDARYNVYGINADSTSPIQMNRGDMRVFGTLGGAGIKVYASGSSIQNVRMDVSTESAVSLMGIDIQGDIDVELANMDITLSGATDTMYGIRTTAAATLKLSQSRIRMLVGTGTTYMGIMVSGAGSSATVDDSIIESIGTGAGAYSSATLTLSNSRIYAKYPLFSSSGVVTSVANVLYANSSYPSVLLGTDTTCTGTTYNIGSGWNFQASGCP